MIKVDISSYTGNIYGNLTVIPGGYNKGNVWYVRCECRCGAIKDILLGALTRRKKNTTSCGCSNIDINYRKVTQDSTFNIVFNNYRRSAAQRGYAFELSKDKVKELTSTVCYYCGAFPENVLRMDSPYVEDYVYNGIDRVNNALGYVEDNVVPCCKVCNIAKRGMDKDSFIQWARRLNDYQKMKETSGA